MTKPKRKRKPKRYAKLRRTACKHRAHPPSGPNKVIYSVPLEVFQLKALRRLARERGTTVAQELEHAIDGYLLGLPPSDIRMLNTILERFHATMDKNNRRLDEALREVGKSNTRLGRLERSRPRRPR